MNNIVEFKQVNVQYPGTHFYQSSTQVLSNINFSLSRGEVVGLIGSNGAGKTTFIKTLLGLLSPHSGWVEVMGYPMPDQRAYQHIGYLPEQPIFYPFLSAYELLEMYARVFDLPKTQRKARIKDVLARVGLAGVPESRLLSHYSKGMLQRFGIAQAIFHQPDLLILDEPMSGLDPMGRFDMGQLIQSLAQEGKTILFSSHILHDVETLCTRVGMIYQGSLIESQSMDELLFNTLRGIEIVLAKVPALDQVLTSHQIAFQQKGERILLYAANYTELNQFLNLIQSTATQVLGLNVLRSSLDEYFVQKTREQGEIT